MENDRLLQQRADVLTVRAPWLRDKVLKVLVAHRKMWISRFEQITALSRDSRISDTHLAAAARDAADEIQAAGVTMYRQITQWVNKEAMEQTEKPAAIEWTPEQRREGLEKLEGFGHG